MKSDKSVLVVDLDGTLLKSDMLYESLFSAFGRNWRSPLFAATALARGKAALKSYLQSQADIDATSLPWPQCIPVHRRMSVETVQCFSRSTNRQMPWCQHNMT